MSEFCYPLRFGGQVLGPSAHGVDTVDRGRVAETAVLYEGEHTVSPVGTVKKVISSFDNRHRNKYM